MTQDASSARAADPTTQRMQALALAMTGGLIVLGVAWELWLAPTGSGTLALKVLPLVLCLAGLLRHRLYTYRWLSLLVWFYFTEGVVRATTESGMSQVLAIAEIALTLGLFAACTMYIRWRLRQGRLLNA
ncbi:DUF2069 domain-containing protein [Rubrivivax albus]|uniref:DUF2069 domain-containing protein n=1 Tax=Rubrivivax albus TaxID=2499835 RepID=A0A437K1R7_9BURK|nr:DUF2069 domain-containing protein [Rubrivivax albus]RVT54306.1 DUF2069 domain-containing protein [Rubrivivax albus]